MKKTISILLVSIVSSFVFCQTAIDEKKKKKSSIYIFDSINNGRTIVKEIYNDSTEDYFFVYN